MRAYAAAFNHQRRKNTQQSNVYFQGSKKGQVGELRVMLKNNLDGKNQLHRKEIIKKIIAYTTLGVDTSRIFPQMVMASNTNDIDEKKLIYFYLGIYAEEYSDVAIMAINTFIKGCSHTDFRIRGLSLKSLCSLKFRGAEQYIMPKLKQGLNDQSAYVRRAAAIGVSKVFYMNPELKNDLTLLDKLYAMIRDPDGNVVVNAIVALNEILESDGGIVLTDKLATYLLNRLNDYNECIQIVILDLLHGYSPKQDNDVFSIMNLLDAKLKQSSTGLVLAAVKLFVKYAGIKETLFVQIIERVRQPLLTLITSTQVDGYQTTFVVLQHILYIVSSLKGKQQFEKYYKHFFCKVDQPTYIKLVKIDILKYLASNANMSDIFNELEEYSSEDEFIARRAISALGEIAIRVPVQYCRLIIKILIKTVQLQREHVCNEAVLVFQEVLRRFPKEFSLISVSLDILIQYVSDSKSKCALLLILGEFGDEIPYAPQYVEQFTYDNFEHLPGDLKEAVLRSSIFLFLKRPKQMLGVLSRVFERVINADVAEVNLKDLAAQYYRAMQTDMPSFKQLYLTSRPFADMAVEELPKFEFNSLEVIYHQPKEKFIRDVRSFGRMYALQFNPEMLKQPQAQQEYIIDIDVDPKYKILEAEDLQPQFSLEAEQFEKFWTQLTEGACITRMLQNTEVVNEDNLQELFKIWRVSLMASGTEDNVIKMYFYAKVEKVACMQLQINLDVGTLTLMTKCQNEELAGFVSKYVEQFLKINDII